MSAFQLATASQTRNVIVYQRKVDSIDDGENAESLGHAREEFLEECHVTRHNTKADHTKQASGRRAPLGRNTIT